MWPSGWLVGIVVMLSSWSPPQSCRGNNGIKHLTSPTCRHKLVHLSGWSGSVQSHTHSYSFAFWEREPDGFDTSACALDAVLACRPASLRVRRTTTNEISQLMLRDMWEIHQVHVHSINLCVRKLKWVQQGKYFQNPLFCSLGFHFPASFTQTPFWLFLSGKLRFISLVEILDCQSDQLSVSRALHGSSNYIPVQLAWAHVAVGQPL